MPHSTVSDFDFSCFLVQILWFVPLSLNGDKLYWSTLQPGSSSTPAHVQLVLLCCCPSSSLCCCAVGTYADLRTAIKERDLAVLAVHGRKEWNPAAPATLRPASSYTEQEVEAAAAELLQRVRGATRARFLLRLAATGCAWPRQCSRSLLREFGNVGRADVGLSDTCFGDNRLLQRLQASWQLQHNFLHTTLLCYIRSGLCTLRPDGLLKVHGTFDQLGVN